MKDLFLFSRLIKMSLLTKNIFNNLYYKRISLYKYICNEIGLINVQYYTCLNNSSNRWPVFKPKSLGERKIITVNNIENAWLNLCSKFNEQLKAFVFSREHLYSGFLWYQSLETINVPDFFVLLEMPDTFYSNFKVLELHVWMLLYHLPQNGRIRSNIRYGLIEAMWKDTEFRAKAVDKYNLNFRKNMKALYAQFQIALLLYDWGFSQNDITLASALWYIFFDRADVDPRILEVLISYVRHQMNELNKLNFEKLTESGSRAEKEKIWIPFEPFVKNISINT